MGRQDSTHIVLHKYQDFPFAGMLPWFYVLSMYIYIFSYLSINLSIYLSIYLSRYINIYVFMHENNRIVLAVNIYSSYSPIDMTKCAIICKYEYNYLFIERTTAVYSKALKTCLSWRFLQPLLAKLISVVWIQYSRPDESMLWMYINSLWISEHIPLASILCHAVSWCFKWEYLHIHIVYVWILRVTAYNIRVQDVYIYIQKLRKG